MSTWNAWRGRYVTQRGRCNRFHLGSDTRTNAVLQNSAKGIRSIRATVWRADIWPEGQGAHLQNKSAAVCMRLLVGQGKLVCFARERFED